MAEGLHVFTEADVRRLLDGPSALEAAEAAFLGHARGGLPAPGRIDAYLDQGEFHVKAGFSPGFFAVKANSGFFANPPERPGIQGAVLLFDTQTGTPVAVVHSGSLTGLRTAAATAVAARALSSEDSRVVALLGAGPQAWEHARALVHVRPIERVVVWSRRSAAAEALADRVRTELERDALVVSSPTAAAVDADIVVTVTPADAPLLGPGDVRPGTFVGAVGADSPAKQELHAALVAGSAVVTDVTAQCAAAGELHHALAAGLMALDDVRAELGDVLAGTRPGRLGPDEVVVFDSTGTGFQDAAAAARLLANHRHTEGCPRCVNDTYSEDT